MAQDRRAGGKKAFASRVDLQQRVQIRVWGQLGPPSPLQTEAVPGPPEEHEGIPWLRPPMNVHREGGRSPGLGRGISLGFGTAGFLSRSRTSPGLRGHRFRIHTLCSAPNSP